jgi:hypothetical protein
MIVIRETVGMAERWWRPRQATLDPCDKARVSASEASRRFTLYKSLKSICLSESRLCVAVESNLAKAVKEEQAKSNVGKPVPSQTGAQTEDSLTDK